MTDSLGTYQWTAPELFAGAQATVAADVYSFGVLLAELSTHSIPYAGLVNPETGRPWTQLYIMSQVVAGTLKPSFDATSPSWFRNRSDRTSFRLGACLTCSCLAQRATYEALQKLQPMDSTGNGYNVSVVQSTSTDCNTTRGTLLPLWNTSVCVVLPAAIESTSITILFIENGTLLAACLGAVVACAIVTLVFVLIRRHKVRADEAFATAMGITDLALYKLSSQELLLDRRIPLHTSNDVTLWRATFRGTLVAVKRLTTQQPSAIAAFVGAMQLVAKLESPHVVRLVGFSWTGRKDVGIVTEYMDLGDLQRHLSSHVPEAFPWGEKVLVLQSIVFGLVYLHTMSPPVLHRNLKSSKVLLDTLKGTKLTGFGVATDGSDEDTMTRSLGSYQWMAPEVIKEAHYSTASDIYAFGVIVSELTTHKVPYENVVTTKTKQHQSQAQILSKIVTGEVTPTFDAKAPESVVRMGRACLALDPAARPTALELTVEVDRLLAELGTEKSRVFDHQAVA
ncbi:protein kinase [Achlya hypogyna]|uniref:Protein kinase n=1 Tax=Achlya hypogyna TaxID=1202772 RepID=A0A1V9ZF55_ACHHY|nr:protein kinase [Achlya hypogyna]